MLYFFLCFIYRQRSLTSLWLIPYGGGSAFTVLLVCLSGKLVKLWQIEVFNLWKVANLGLYWSVAWGRNLVSGLYVLQILVFFDLGKMLSLFLPSRGKVTFFRCLWIMVVQFLVSYDSCWIIIDFVFFLENVSSGSIILVCAPKFSLCGFWLTSYFFWVWFLYILLLYIFCGVELVQFSYVVYISFCWVFIYFTEFIWGKIKKNEVCFTWSTLRGKPTLF